VEKEVTLHAIVKEEEAVEEVEVDQEEGVTDQEVEADQEEDVIDQEAEKKEEEIDQADLGAPRSPKTVERDPPKNLDLEADQKAGKGNALFQKKKKLVIYFLFF